VVAHFVPWPQWLPDDSIPVLGRARYVPAFYEPSAGRPWVWKLHTRKAKHTRENFYAFGTQTTVTRLVLQFDHIYIKTRKTDIERFLKLGRALTRQATGADMPQEFIDKIRDPKRAPSTRWDPGHRRLPTGHGLYFNDFNQDHRDHYHRTYALGVYPPAEAQKWDETDLWSPPSGAFG